jgi:hypothetical protein
VRSGVALAALAAAVTACGGGTGEEVVRGFHGHPWGTETTAIPEIAGSGPVGEKDGLAIYSAEVTYLGREVLAGFYFHPRTGGLVEGYYVFALALEECEREWARHVGDLEAAYPALVKEERVPTRPEADSTRYVSDCEYYVYRGDLEEWRADFVNPAPPEDRAGAWIDVVGRSLRMTVFYQGGAARAWQGRFRWPFRIPRRPETPPEPPAPRPPATEGLPFGRA